MDNGYLYHYKINRKQRSKTFIRIGLACLLYIGALFIYEIYSGDRVPENLRSICIYAFSFSAAAMFYIAWWHIKNPATYEAYITSQKFVVDYPDSPIWSFNVNISDIEKFEHRQTLSHAGRGIVESGIVMKNGEFHEIVMNYGNNINKMHAALKDVNRNITFSKRVNQKFQWWPFKK